MQSVKFIIQFDVSNVETSIVINLLHLALHSTKVFVIVYPIYSTAI